MNDINPIKPPIAMPVLTPGLVASLLVLSGAVLLAAGIVLFWYIRKKRQAAKKNTEQRTAAEEEAPIDFRKKLAEGLRMAKELLDKGDYKTFHLYLSGIIKEYLSYAYRVNFVDLTTYEILQSDGLPSGKRSMLKEFFSLTDLAKFAGLAEEKARAEKAYELAIKVADENRL